jgi:hypothetical protein
MRVRIDGLEGRRCRTALIGMGRIVAALVPLIVFGVSFKGSANEHQGRRRYWRDVYGFLRLR